MEIAKIGSNTKNAEGIKISREIKTAFDKYLKAKQELKETVKVKGEKDEITYDKITVEQLYVSYLATFMNSEDYKSTISTYDNAKQEAKDKRQNAREDKKKNLKAQYIEEGYTEEQAERIATIAVAPMKKKITKKDTE